MTDTCTLGNLLPRLEEDKSESWSGHGPFFPFVLATQVYFVMELARATKHQGALVGLVQNTS